MGINLSSFFFELEYFQFYLLNRLDSKESTNRTKNIQKIIIAISVAPAAMPPNPKIPAIIAITRKITIQRIIIYKVLVISMPLK